MLGCQEGSQAVEITVEAVILAVGWVTALLFGVFVALKITAPAAKRLTIDAIKDPEGELAKLRKAERDEIEAMFDRKIARFGPLLQTVEVEENGKKFQANALLVQLNQLVDLANELAGAAVLKVKNEAGQEVEVPLGDGLPVLIDQKMRAHRQGGKMRGDGGGGEPTALEGALEDVEWAANNPEQAEALAVAHSSIDSLAPVFNWDEKKVRQFHKQANDLAVQGRDLKAFIDRLNGSRLVGSQSGGGGQRGAGAPSKLGL